LYLSILSYINYNDELINDKLINDKIQNHRLVKNCGSSEYHASILITNKTHTFDMQNCVWKSIPEEEIKNNK
jgi:hypothetical protein